MHMPKGFVVEHGSVSFAPLHPPLSTRNKNMSSKSTEQMIQESGATAPRLNPQHIEGTIVGELYTRPTGTLTVCVLTLRNGTLVTGESACVSPENFNEAIGRKVAREDAFRKIWALEGYLLKERLYQASQIPCKEVHTENPHSPNPTVMLELVPLIADKLAVDKAKIGLDSRIVGDLGADSLDRVELIMACEDRFNIEISDEEAGPVETVRDAANLIASKLPTK
jgi:acyl carrier protein